MDTKKGRWVRAAIPALMLHCSIGTVYCWSLIKGDIAEYIGRSVSELEWAFSLAIFCLGISAAFGGKFVERDIHRASLLSAIMFSLGFAGTGISVYFKSLIGVYIFYGVIMGIGLGIGYLTPVKTLMLWFSDQKGLATGIAVAGFGLAKVIASPAITVLLGTVGIVNMFYILTAIYFVMMMGAHFLLKKPDSWVEKHDEHDETSIHIIKNPTFIGIWLIFYINITCGLALVSQEKDLLSFMGVSAATIAVILSITAIFNAAGRIIYSSLADKLKDRNTMYKIMLTLSLLASFVAFFTNMIELKMVVGIVVALAVINMGYGGGFSNLPALLADNFGMKQVSQIHGLALSAWAVAGLSGNQISSYIINKTDYSYEGVLVVTGIMYAIALVCSFCLIKKKK